MCHPETRNDTGHFRLSQDYLNRRLCRTAILSRAGTATMPITKRVVVELRVPRRSLSSLRTAADSIRLPSLQIDSDLLPIPVAAATQRMQISLDAADERLILLRGSMDEARIDDLRRHANVIGVYADSVLAPFHFADAAPQRSRFGVLSMDETELCPIPPCDCDAIAPRGCLLDVAMYLGVNRIWKNEVRGQGIVIGIIDGGLAAEVKLDGDLPGLVPRVIGGWPEGNWGTLARWCGHGNKMAINVLGMAPLAELYDIRISDSAVTGASVSDAIAGFNWAIERFRKRGTPQILCCGWGLFQRSDDPVYAASPSHPLTRKVVEALDEGIVVLFAAGNGGQSCPSPACGDDIGPGKSIWGANGHPRVITVGAANSAEHWIGYSSQGPAALDEYKPDFCGISHFAGYNSCDSGTSTACAVATGVVALLKQSKPNLSQEAIKRLLKTTAKGIGPPGWNRHAGAGIIRAGLAYDAVIGDSGPAHSAQLERLELENHYLKELFVELALERRILAARQD
jgi:serine protease AprX